MFKCTKLEFMVLQVGSLVAGPA